ncbi:MAG: hypothetical protein ACTJGD_10790 [Mesonia hippocampi]|uniref:hypothetical protein n=1 Tax=Mesonia hippocampi TaxID=1628250 RepID=UPI003F9AA00E
MSKLFLVVFLFSISMTAQKIDRKTFYDYSEDLEFRIYTIYKNRYVEKGNAGVTSHYVAKKGERFVTFVFQFKNNSTEHQEIDFTEIYLRDDNGKLHTADMVAMTMKITTRSDRFKQKLRAKKKRKIIARFVPPFDKNEIIDELIIGDKLIKLKYN